MLILYTSLTCVLSQTQHKVVEQRPHDVVRYVVNKVVHTFVPKSLQLYTDVYVPEMGCKSYIRTAVREETRGDEREERRRK